MEQKSSPTKIGELLFETSDLSLAAYLRYCGLQIKRTYQQKGKTAFCFMDRQDRKELVFKYFNGKAQVSPLEFKNLLKDMKLFTTLERPL